MEIPNRGGEYVSRPTTPFEAVSHELSIHTDKDSFSAALDEYEQRYFDTNFGLSLLNHTDAIAEAHSKLWTSEPIPSSANAAFYRGAIFGLHSTLRCIPDELTETILGAKFNMAIDPYEGETRESLGNRTSGIVLDQLDLTRESMKALAPRDAITLKLASARAYDSFDRSGYLHRERFEMGMLHSMWVAFNTPVS